jgi:hypothetical protein
LYIELEDSYDDLWWSNRIEKRVSTYLTKFTEFTLIIPQDDYVDKWWFESKGGNISRTKLTDTLFLTLTPLTCLFVCTGALLTQE